MNGPVLVILPHNPGDVVMALQAIGRLKADRPLISFDYMVSEECRSLVEGSPVIRNAHIIPRRPLKEAWDRNDASAAVALVEAFLLSLADTQYELSLNLFQERFGGIIQSFVTAGRKVGLELIQVDEGGNFRITSRYLEHLFAIPASRHDNAWHAVDIYIRAARQALNHLAPIPECNPRPRTRRDAKPFPVLPALKRPDACSHLSIDSYLVFHPGSAWAGKRWPERHWAGLASACLGAGLSMVFTGAPEERPVMDRILAQLPPGPRDRLIDCVGKTDLLGAAWLMANARFVVTGDTVAMHLAAAAGTPAIALFGASNPIETGPYGLGHIVLQTDPDPLPDLALDQENRGLAGLSPEGIAAFILEGVLEERLPDNVLAWQTDWDMDRDMQILVDARRRPHPDSLRGESLLQTLDRGHDSQGKGGKASDTLGARRRLRAAIDGALSRPDAQNLAALESAERDLAKETQASLIWEAYRIAVNGLPLRDLARHLALRRSRFEMALDEERQAANPAIT